MASHAVAAGTNAQRPRLRVVGPSLRDPRLHVAAVIIAVQVLGQAVLDFRLSIAQILVCIALGGLIEVAVVLVRERTLAWPASGLLTGNSTAFILRTPGTHHGDWWSFNGIWIFVGVVVVAMASKYVIQRRGQHVFNPSNLALVLAFVALGPRYTEPQDLWWIPTGPWLYATYAILIGGGLLIAWELKLVTLVLGFMLAFAATAGVGLLVVPDHCMVASWSAAPLCEGTLWQLLVTSPELLVFGLFMVPDPRTVPGRGPARLPFGIAVGLLAGLLIGPGGLEFWTKTGILGSLVVACAARFLLVRLLAAEVGGVTQPRGRVRAGWVVVMCSLALGLYAAPVFADVGARAPIPAAELPNGSTQVIELVAGRGPGYAAWAAKAAADALPSGSLTPQTQAGSARAWILPAVPDVVIPQAVTSFDPNITPRKAAAMARETLRDLLVEAEARRTHDEELARQGATGEALGQFVDVMRQDGRAGRSVQATFGIDRVELRLYLPKYATQTPRLVGVFVHAKVTTKTVGPGGDTSSATSDYARSWGLLQLGGPDSEQLIVNEYTDLAPA